MSSSDMWQPKQPASEVVATRSFFFGGVHGFPSGVRTATSRMGCSS